MTEDTVLRTLRDAEIPKPPQDLLARLREARRSPRNHWAAPTALAAGIGALAIAGIVLRPTMSLADVVNAMEAQTQYTLTTTRIKGSETYSIHFYRSGPLWRTQTTYGLPDRTVRIDPLLRYVLIDAPRKAPVAEFRIDRLLRVGVKPKVERNFLWKGRRVDRFTLSDTYRAQGQTESFDQEVLADPKTKLPIRISVMRAGGTWGDITDYDFSPPPASVFVPEISASAKVFDLVEQRKEVAKQVAAHGGVIIVDEEDRIYMLTLGTKDQSLFVPKTLHIDGLREPLALQSVPFFVRRQPDYPRNNVHTKPTVEPIFGIKIGERYWTVCRPADPPGDLDWAKKLAALPNISGTLTSAKTTTQRGDATVHYKDLKIIRTGEGYSFIRSFFGDRRVS